MTAPPARSTPPPPPAPFAMVDRSGLPPLPDLGARRLAFHTAESEAKDARFSQWSRDKATAARRGLSLQALYAAGPRGLRQMGHDSLAAQLDLAWITAIELLRADDPERAQSIRRRALIQATEWDDCECGRVFKPGPRLYRSCFICNQMQNAAGRPSCSICSRRHSSGFGCCFVCKSGGLEDAARHIRSVTTRRDAFTCNMCGTTEGSMEVDHILPVGLLGGSAQPWNLQVLCTTCQILKSDRYGALDELARLDLMLAYDNPDHLADFLFADEREALRLDLADTLGGYLFSPSSLISKYACPPDLGIADELDAVLTVAHAFGARPEQISHVAKPAPRDDTSPPATPARMVFGPLDLTGTPDPCKGEVHLSTGRRPCANTVNYRVGILCPGPCR